MKIYSHYGFREFILCLGYKGELLKQYFLQHELMHNDFTLNLRDHTRDRIHHHEDADDWTITFAETGLAAGTGTRLARVKKYLDGEQFMVTYADGVSDVNIKNLLAVHKKSRAGATLTAIRPPSRFGMMDFEPDGLVKTFIEKPALKTYVNGGFYVFEHEIFDHIGTDEGCMLESKPLESMAAKRRLYLYKHDGFWHQMDTYKDFLDLNAMWDSGKQPWRVW
jgi:glucose-1-phosphate cytidylyltransferase